MMMKARFAHFFFGVAAILAAAAASAAPPAAKTPVAHPKPPVAAQPAPPARPAPPPKNATASEVDALTRDALKDLERTRLPRGAAIKAIRATSQIPLPPPPRRSTIEVTPPPRRAGAVTATAVVTVWKDDVIVGRIPVAIDLDVPPEALVWEVPKGAPVVLVVKRDTFEVSAPAVAGNDGDIGDVITVLLRPSGRQIRAKLIAKDRAVAMEER
jgi:hypothetical protein